MTCAMNANQSRSTSCVSVLVLKWKVNVLQYCTDIALHISAQYAMYYNTRIPIFTGTVHIALVPLQEWVHKHLFHKNYIKKYNVFIGESELATMYDSSPSEKESLKHRDLSHDCRKLYSTQAKFWNDNAGSNRLHLIA